MNIISIFIFVTNTSIYNKSITRISKKIFDEERKILQENQTVLELILERH